MEQAEFNVLANILQDNIGQKITVALGLGIIDALSREIKQVQEQEANEIPMQDDENK